ncbi:MAG TPA: type II secretion system F family protein [Anaerolineales bacterium]|nr:type II secretion system F family protein [Anaerolineales bacterium]
MDIILTGFLSILLLTIGLGVLLFGFIRIRRDDVSNRLEDYVIDPDSPGATNAEFEVRSRQLSGSFVNRVMIPNVRKVTGFLGRITPAGSIERLERQLMLAGNPLRLGAREFYGMQIALSFAGIYLSIVFLTRGLTPLNVALGVATPIVAFLLPQLWLLSKVRRRQERIRRGLPDALDMLSVCATAGLGFDQALQRVSDYWKSEIGQEFGRAVTEMSMGISRQEALRNLADRVDIVELSSFVTLIVQSDQLGMSIADTLHAQADQMRLFRRLRAEEEIRKLPVKLLIPISLFIFPAVLAVVLGPSVPVMIELFQDF